MYGKLFPPRGALAVKHHANKSKVFKFTPQRPAVSPSRPAGSAFPEKETGAGEELGRGERAGRCGQGDWGGERGAELGIWAVSGSKGGQQRWGVLAGGDKKRQLRGVHAADSTRNTGGGRRKDWRGLLSHPSRVLLPKRRLTPGAGRGGPDQRASLAAGSGRALGGLTT